MARAACTDYLSMIDHRCRGPGINAVAIFTDRRCLNVRRVLAGCVNTVVAARAIAGDINVIKICWRPGHSCVAIIAIVATGEMVEILAGCRDAVMTGTTAAKHLCVVNHVRRQPGD